MDATNILRLLSIVVPICVLVIGAMGVGWLSWFVKSMGDKNYFPMASGVKLENEVNVLRDEMWKEITQTRRDVAFIREWMARHDGMERRIGHSE